jgi:ribosome-associated protein
VKEKSKIIFYPKTENPATQLMIKKTKRPKKKVSRKKGSEHLAESVISGMQEKKGQEIVSIDIRKFKNAIADFFIICHAESHTHVEAIADSVEEMVYKLSGETPAHKEGKENAEWILMDYINVIVHIFRKDRRDFYGVERLWADATVRTIAVNY